MKAIVLAGLLVAQVAWAELPVDRQQTVDHVARDVTAVGSEAQGCHRQRKCLEAVAQKLDATVRRLGGLDKGLGLLDREELGIRIAWKVEPAVERATVALQLAVGQTETDDDRRAERTRQAAAQLYQWRDEVLHGGQEDREVVYAKIAPALEKARPAAGASTAVREDFEQTAEAAGWTLREALYPRGDPHASPAFNKLVLEMRMRLEAIGQRAPDLSRATQSLRIQHDLEQWTADAARRQGLTAAEAMRFELWSTARAKDAGHYLSERQPAPQRP
jgi:hypothetical protein